MTPPVRVTPLSRDLLDGIPGEDGERVRVDLGIVPLASDERPLQGLLGLVDWREDGRFSAFVRSGYCSGTVGEHVLVPGTSTMPVERLVLLGIGPSSGLDEDRGREIGGAFAAMGARLSERDVLVALPSGLPERATLEAMLAALLEGLERSLGPRHDRGPWWIAVEPRHLARVRALVEGPPRAAEPGDAAR